MTLKNRRGAILEKGKNQIDDCGLRILDWDEERVLSVILRLRDPGAANKRATAFRFWCHVESIRGWKGRGF